MKQEEAIKMWDEQSASLHELLNCKPAGVLEALNIIKERVKRERVTCTPSQADIERMKQYALWIDCLTTLILYYRKDLEERKCTFKGVLEDIDGMLKRI